MRRSLLLALAAVGLLSGCSSLMFWRKSEPLEQPAPLKPFTASTQITRQWYLSGGDIEKTLLQPAVSGEAVFAASAKGDVSRIEKGKKVWTTRIDEGLVAGVGAGYGLVVVASRRGVLTALDEKDGKRKWVFTVTGEINGAPMLDGDQVYARVGDARIVALDMAGGKPRWTYSRTTPPLSLRTYNGLRRFDRFVFAGFAGGRLAAVSTNNGQLAWEGSVAFPKGSTELERLADVVGEAVPSGRRLCAAAFQGRVTCFDVSKGEAIWGRDISSPVGVDADSRRVFVTDERGAVYALDADSGATIWKQDELKLRRVGRPLSLDNYVAVADFEGYVHLLDKSDGHFVARLATDGTPIAAPLVRTDEGFVAQTEDGALYALKAD
ncbi:outer membrane protein assembly factor BamB [Niveibacterium sp. SC-1]|uniref:outer membrane protein assembly factor BamB n=1 Tax=Niveibacterium sp. SC-1 TaxID=3135646 RepID=UPI00311D96D4